MATDMQLFYFVILALLLECSSFTALYADEDEAISAETDNEDGSDEEENEEESESDEESDDPEQDQ